MQPFAERGEEGGEATEHTGGMFAVCMIGRHIGVK